MEGVLAVLLLSEKGEMVLARDGLPARDAGQDSSDPAVSTAG